MTSGQNFLFFFSHKAEHFQRLGTGIPFIEAKIQALCQVCLEDFSPYMFLKTGRVTSAERRQEVVEVC